MIFSSQLGKINTASAQEGIAQVANHIRKMQEELEYRLMNLSSDNISEIDAKQTTILLSDGQQLGDAMLGNYAKLEASVNGLRGEVSSLNGRFNSYSTIAQTSDAITAAVSDLNTSTILRLDKDGLHIMGPNGRDPKDIGGGVDEEYVETLITNKFISTETVFAGQLEDTKGYGSLSMAGYVTVDGEVVDGAPWLKFVGREYRSNGTIMSTYPLLDVHPLTASGSWVTMKLGGYQLFTVMNGSLVLSDLWDDVEINGTMTAVYAE